MSEKSELISRLKTKKKSRDAYTRALLSVLVPSQIRALRFRNKLTQKALAKEADMKQSRISTVERPGASQLNVETLIRLASAFKVGLKVEFVSFSEMLRWENEFSQDAFSPVTIERDAEFSGEGVAAPLPSANPERAVVAAVGSQNDANVAFQSTRTTGAATQNFFMRYGNNQSQPQMDGLAATESVSSGRGGNFAGFPVASVRPDMR